MSAAALSLGLIGSALLLIPARSRLGVMRGVPAHRLPEIAAVATAIAVLATLKFGVATPFVVLGSALLTRHGMREVLARGSRPPPLVDESTPLMLDLVATALRAGETTADSLLAVAQIAPPPLSAALERVAVHLRLGGESDQAWALMGSEDGLAQLARAGARSADSGIRLAQTCESVSAAMRRRGGAAAQAKVAQVATWAMAPLGLCFLPAFICLGVVPTVAGLLSHISTQMRTGG